MDNIKDNSIQVKRASKEKIFLEAAKHFARQGYHGTSVRDISKSADVNVALINYHFKSKENLFLEVAKYGTEMLNHEVEKSRGQDLEKIVEQMFYLATDQSGPAYFVSVILSMVTGSYESNQEFIKTIFLKPSNLELCIREAVSRKTGISVDDANVQKAGYIIMAFLFHKALIRFGINQGRVEGYLSDLYPNSNETFLSVVQDMTQFVCGSLRSH